MAIIIFGCIRIMQMDIHGYQRFHHAQIRNLYWTDISAMMLSCLSANWLGSDAKMCVWKHSWSSIQCEGDLTSNLVWHISLDWYEAEEIGSENAHHFWVNSPRKYNQNSMNIIEWKIQGFRNYFTMIYCLIIVTDYSLISIPKWIILYLL